MPRGGGGDEASSPRPASSAASTVVAFPSKTEDVEAYNIMTKETNGVHIELVRMWYWIKIITVQI